MSKRSPASKHDSMLSLIHWQSGGIAQSDYCFCSDNRVRKGRLAYSTQSSASKANHYLEEQVFHPDDTLR